ncbi:RNA polymerase sigma factor [Arenimonas sp. MALMAid1274]|uniref:RNA polymerase sigma factor n=1 Tax=Arenimonas sp. MALMAid1274 TaxID=3411630 RepID=UPI003BA35220
MSTARPDPARSDFETLMAAHRGIVVKVAASYCRDAEDRADLAQEISLQLWRAWPGYDPARRFSTWLYRIALNVAISHLRRERGRPAPDALGEAHEHLVGARDVDAEQREQLALVQAAMQSLGALDKALLLLHLEGCSHRDSGEILGIREGNVATRLGRIRQQLRRTAAAAHINGDDHGTD